MSRAHGKRTPRWVGLDELMGADPGGGELNKQPHGGETAAQTPGTEREEGIGAGYDERIVPGGQNHMGNPPVHRQAVPVPEREWPYRRGLLAHGVPPDGQHHDRDPRLSGGQRGQAKTEKPPPRQTPVPVYIVEADGGGDPMRFAGLQHFTVPAASGEPVMVAPRDLARRGVRILNEGAGATGKTTYAGQGAVTNPSGFTAIASTANVPAGLYTVTATVYLSGTVTAGDADNMFIGGSNIAAVHIASPGLVNSPVTITATVLVTGAGNDNLRVINTNAASSGSAIYHASIQATPASFGAGVRVGPLRNLVYDTQNATIAGGVLMPNGMTSYQEIRTQEAIYAVSADTNTPVISVISESAVSGAAG